MQCSTRTRSYNDIATIVLVCSVSWRVSSSLCGCVRLFVRVARRILAGPFGEETETPTDGNIRTVRASCLQSNGPYISVQSDEYIDRRIEGAGRGSLWQRPAPITGDRSQ